MNGRGKKQEARGKKNAAAVAALVSGGVESAALLQRLTRAGAYVLPLYIRQGYRWERAEVAHLRRLLRHFPRWRLAPLVILHAPVNGVARQHWALGRGAVPGARTPDRAMELPGRNLCLFAAAGAWCAQHGVSRIAHGTLSTNPFPDATPDFFRGMRVVLTRAFERRFHLEAPLRRLTKTEIVKRTNPSLLAATFSCINPQRLRHCGRCNKCAERRLAFRAARLPDPTPYAR